ncbi:MAG TPA: twitch domain-containing radical SAM protein [Candidatus Elarobacter sp.]|nr:twitch domain-containing radical SAM protein [Candidatus Elarobacter sp.]
MSNTVCIIPWTNFVVRPDGTAGFCCEVSPPLTLDGTTPGHLTRDGADALWNAPEIVGVRAAMARGAKPAACRVCWDREAEGGISRRILMNDSYRAWLGHAIERLPEIGAETGYRLEGSAEHFILDMGNVCNLKCRSCSGISSSRIAADRVHAAWNGQDTSPDEVIRVNGVRWSDDIGALAAMLEAAAERDITVTLMGGEPFLMPNVWKLISRLVESGASRRIYLGLLSNGQQIHPKLAEIVPQFRGVNVSLSIDGHGKLYEYLRHGASWETLLRVIDRLHGIPGIVPMAVVTLQNYNALGMVELLRALDDRGMRVAYNAVNDPGRLAHSCLPSGVRRVAERRLRHYLEHECKAENVEVVRAFCHALEPSNDAFDPERFEEFMKFTNDLDATRGESLRDAAPELWSLLRASGVEWSNARRHAPEEPTLTLDPNDILAAVNRTISPNDTIYPGFEAAAHDAYFTSTAQQLAQIDALLRENGHPGFADCTAVADVASHYGRFSRAFRAALPSAAVYACDIDADAVRFCAEELGALPVVIGWTPETDPLPAGVDALICFSLLTHTPLPHWRSSLRAWAKMLRPGGVAAFTYLSDRRIALWRAGEMSHYGAFTDEAFDEVERSVRESGFGFTPLTSEYGDKPLYGITFVTPELVAREIEAAGLEIVAMPENMPTFGQELAIVRKPRGGAARPLPAPPAARDVHVVALYDPRCYVPDGEDADSGDTMWTQVLAGETRPLPTELGFADPRVAEVREAQAALAAEHGIDAFCYRYQWDGRPLWDEPLRRLVESARPGFPFCLMLDVCGPAGFDARDARRLFQDVIFALVDERYLRVGDRPLIVVKDLARIAEPRSCVAVWREAARDAGLGELHLCALDSSRAERPGDLGYDSYVIVPDGNGGYAARAAAAMAAPWPAQRAFRMVESPHGGDEADAPAAYEYWLQSALDVTRRRGEPLVFLDAWNDWSGGRYLEPDDRTGRGMLEATRRAVRGPASGLALVRRLRDALARDGANVDTALAELETVVKGHERGRQQLFALVEAALVRNTPRREEILSRLPVPTRHLAPSPGGALVDWLDGVRAVVLHAGKEPVHLRGDAARIVGWAYCDESALDAIDLFVAFESETGADDALFPVANRTPRPDVAARVPGLDERCGFDATLDVHDLLPGSYRVAVVQRTPRATYRDLTKVVVIREAGLCSSG